MPVHEIAADSRAAWLRQGLPMPWAAAREVPQRSPVFWEMRTAHDGARDECLRVLRALRCGPALGGGYMAALKCPVCGLLHLGRWPCEVPILRDAFRGVELTPEDERFLRWFAGLQCTDNLVSLVDRLRRSLVL